MEDDIDFNVIVIKEELETVEHDAPPRPPVQIKEEIVFVEHDVLHPALRGVFGNPNIKDDFFLDRKEVNQKLQREIFQIIPKTETATNSTEDLVKVNVIKIEEDSVFDEQLFDCKVLIDDCAISLQRGGRYCAECRVLFPRRGALAAHTHTVHNSQKKKKTTSAPDKPFKCDVCDYRSAHRTQLTFHRNTHNKVKPYKCDLCDYRCTQPAHLNAHHNFKHAKVKAFKCDVCDYRCTQSGSMDKHLRLHTGVKPFKCGFCDFASNESSNLKEHVIRIHTKEKAFGCDMCDYKCAKNNDLRKHKRIHFEKALKCNVCTYKCHQKGSMKAHRLRHHAEE